jgi:multidrug efflux pump subunit AcrA (membrane-fusion protein)
MSGEAEAGSGPLLHAVSRGPFNHIVLEQGEVESSSNIEVRCEVKSRNTSGTQIISVLPEGSQVKKGDVIVRLDSSAWSDRDQQRLQYQRSRHDPGHNTFEAANIAGTEYLRTGGGKSSFLSEVFVAEQNLHRRIAEEVR